MPSSEASMEDLERNMPGAFPVLPSQAQPPESTHQTLSQALYERRAEYTRPRHVTIKVGTWNVAAEKGTEKDIGPWFVGGKGVEESLAGLGVATPDPKETQYRETVGHQERRSATQHSTIPYGDEGAVPGNGDVGLYVLGLQEIVDISSATEALRPYTDPTIANRYKTEVAKALPNGYELVAEQQLIGLLVLIYASPDVIPHVKSVSVTSVGTGLMGYMGNKGAVTARIILGETTRLVFINSHLAAGADKAAVERRNWDAGQIMTRTRFDPITDSMGISQGHGEGIGEEDFAFWFGDLNYRLEGMPGEDVRRLLTRHARSLEPESKNIAPQSAGSSEASKAPSDSSNSEDEVPLPPELDPASLQTTILSLLPHDELQQQQKAGKAFHDGWDEGPIRFLPTYKYDVGTVGHFDSSEKKRCPSWCDRILYRTRAAKLRYETKAKEQEEARKRDEQMKAKGLGTGGDEDVLFDYNPETDGDNVDYDEYDDGKDPAPEEVITKEGFHDEIQLQYYTSHMRVLSSDHKPLDAVFSLKFDAVIPELKAAIHQEVARELDRQENEGRPSVTVVVDRATGSGPAADKNKTDSSFDGVDFGDVQFSKSKRRHITIANTGRVPATFGFTDRPVAEGEVATPFPSWLSIKFDREADKTDKPSPDNLHAQYTLEPAEVCNIELKLKIDLLEHVKNLNEDTITLDDILVLRVQGGRDHFLPLRANWLQSTFARSIDKLVRIPEGGIRKLQGQKPSAELGPVQSSAPRELFRLTEALETLTERTVAEWDMQGHDGVQRPPWKDNAGWPFVKDKRYFEDEWNEEMLGNVYEAIDCDTPFDAAFEQGTAAMQKVEILAEVLVRFLKGLTDGVVTADMWTQIETDTLAREKARKTLPPDEERLTVLEVLASAPNHSVSFVLITSMLQRIAAEVSTASAPDPKTPRSSIDLPASPQVSVRRKTLSKVPEVAIKQLINRNYASVFAEAVIRGEGVEKMKEKERVARRERMIRMLELFVAQDEERVK